MPDKDKIEWTISFSKLLVKTKFPISSLSHIMLLTFRLAIGLGLLRISEI